MKFASLLFLFASFGIAQNTPVVRLKSGTVPGNGNCPDWSVSGSVYTLGDTGSPCGMGGSGGGGAIVFSASSVSFAGTQFLAAGGGAGISSTEASVQTASPAAATISNLYVQLSVAPGMGNSIAFTWRDAGSSQTSTCTVSNTATSCNDTTHSFAAAAGDLINFQSVTTGTVIATPTVLISSAFGTSGVGVTSVSFTGGLISVANPTTTPALTVAGTSGGIPYFSGAATWASSAALTAHGVVIGGGAGTAPTSTGAGSSGNVLTSNGASADPTYQAVSACATCLTGTPTNHGVAVGSATQTTNYTGAGTSGQVLTSNGASADPTFQPSAGGTTPALQQIPSVSCTPSCTASTSQVVLSSTAATITFSSIPGTFTDLIVVCNGRTNESANASGIYLQFNADTGANYTRQELLGNNVTASAGVATASAKTQFGVLTAASATANFPGSFTTEILNYAGTTFQKMSFSRIGWQVNSTTSNWFLAAENVLWANTAAITSIVLGSINTASMITGTTCTLYGRL